MNPLKLPRWSPWVAGALIGALGWFTLLTADENLGVSTTFVQTVGLAEEQVAPSRLPAHPYYATHPPKIDWQAMLVVGIFLGAWLSARLAGTRNVEVVPEAWARRFGRGRALRFTAAFLGGGVLMYGARLAGGCTSGHGLSGTLQLALSSWVFFAVFFGVGVGVARLLYGPPAARGAGA